MMTDLKIKIRMQLEGKKGKKNTDMKNGEQRVTEDVIWKIRNGQKSKEELLKILEGKSKEVTKEEGITITAIGVGEGLKKQP